jgi:serine/threonine protein kinase
MIEPAHAALLPMLLICPGCHTPLPHTPPGELSVACTACALEVDLSRLGTVAGKPRFVPERDRSGTQAGDYQLEARVGAGGMGQVYRGVRETPGGREVVAVKFLSTGLAGDPALVARFEREIKLLAGLEHPAIVRVLGHGDSDGVPWFAMTLVEGPSLRARLAQGALSVEEARAVFGRVLAGLGHAHARGIIHRDLKPANLLLAADGAMLADFGVARLDEGFLSAATRLTETAAVLGTVPYMSPEQRAGRPVDRRSDLFSVGVMIYEALTGVLPQGAFPPPSRLAAGVPAKLDAVVLRLLQPRAEDRFDSALDTAAALAAALAPRRSRRVALLAAGASAALAALGLFSGLALHLPRAASVSVEVASTREAPALPAPELRAQTQAAGPDRTPTNVENAIATPDLVPGKPSDPPNATEGTLGIARRPWLSKSKRVGSKPESNADVNAPAMRVRTPPLSRQSAGAKSGPRPSPPKTKVASVPGKPGANVQAQQAAASPLELSGKVPPPKRRPEKSLSRQDLSFYPVTKTSSQRE